MVSMAHDVFISHSKTDKQVADALCAAFESQGVRCWIAPRDVPPGSDWASEIIKAISGSRVMVLVFSAAAADSAHVRHEITAAANAGVVIVPFKIDTTDPTGAMQYYLADTHWLDAVNPPTTEQIGEAVLRVASLLDKEVDTGKLVVPKQKRRLPMPAIAAVVVVLVALVAGGAYLVTRGHDDQPSGTPQSVTTPSGTASPTATTMAGAATYAEVVAQLPAGSKPVDFEADIISSLQGSTSIFLRFSGRWESHQVMGDIEFSLKSGRWVSTVVHTMDSLKVNWTQDASINRAYKNPEFAYFMNTLGTELYGAKLTNQSRFVLAGTDFSPGDTMTLDGTLRLVKVTW